MRPRFPISLVPPLPLFEFYPNLGLEKFLALPWGAAQRENLFTKILLPFSPLMSLFCCPFRQSLAAGLSVPSTFLHPNHVPVLGQF